MSGPSLAMPTAAGAGEGVSALLLPARHSQQLVSPYAAPATRQAPSWPVRCGGGWVDAANVNDLYNVVRRWIVELASFPEDEEMFAQLREQGAA